MQIFDRDRDTITNLPEEGGEGGDGGDGVVRFSFCHLECFEHAPSPRGVLSILSLKGGTVDPDEARVPMAAVTTWVK